MIIVHHPETLAPQHIIYEHPENYHEVVEAQGHAWIYTQTRMSVEQIRLSRHPDTNALQLHRAGPGDALELIEHDDKLSIVEKRAARAQALAEATRLQKIRETLTRVTTSPAFAHVWTVSV